ncbi:MAG: hypothetical protein RL398_1465 [Planctomycetota bacterium]
MFGSRPWVWPLLLAVLISGGWYFGFRAKDGDRELPVYVQGSQRMLAGEEVYRVTEDKKPFTYPPFAAVPTMALVKVAPKWQPAVWFGMQFLLLFAIARWLHRWAERDDPEAGPPRLRLFWLLTLLLGVHHVISVLTNQSHDLLIAASVLLVAAGASRGGAGGWLLAGLGAGAGAAIKATPGLFLGLFGLRLRWFGLLGLVIGAAGLTLLPDWLYPRGDGKPWAVAWYEVNLSSLGVGRSADAGAWGSHSFLNQGLSGTLTRLFSPPPTVELQPDRTFVHEHAMVAALSPTALRFVTLFALAGVLGLITWGVRRIAVAESGAADSAAARRRFGLAEAAMFACGMVLLSPQSSKAHFCVWLFPAAYLADRLLRGRRDPILWLLVAAAAAVGPLASKGIVGRELGNLLLAYGNVAWCTLLLLLAVIRACPPRRAT